MNESSEQEKDMEATSAPPNYRADRLTRSLDDRAIAGVAGGLAKHFNIDPLIVRIAFIASIFLGGLGLVAYLAAWILVPEEGSDRTIAQSARRIPNWILIGVLIVASIVVIAQLSAPLGGGVAWAIVLIAAGVLLYRGDVAPRRKEPSIDGPPPTSPPDEGAPTQPASGGAFVPPPVPPSTPRAMTARLPRVRPRRERSYLGRYTFAAMLLALGITAALQNAGTISPRPEQYPAIALLVLGGGLLVGTIWGRARGLILLGLFVVGPIAFAASIIDVPFEGGFGERSYAPSAATDLGRDYHLVAGRMLFDLTGVEWEGQRVEIDATVVAGEIAVVVPRGIPVRLDAQIGTGMIDLFGYTRDGFNTEYHNQEPVGLTDNGVLLDAEVSFGSIQVIRSPIKAKGI